SEIINGKSALTPETALQLERVVKVPADFWNRLEANYRNDLARIAEAERLITEVSWAKGFPLAAMRKYGWIDSVKDPALLVDSLLSFFGVASVDAWRSRWGHVMCSGLSFRKSKTYSVDARSLSAWLRHGEIVAGKMNVAKFNKERFIEGVNEIRNLVLKKPFDFTSDMIRICAQAGVALVFTKELPKVPVHGVTRWIRADQAIIQLSLRYRTDDHFWFSFFHEAGHVILHGKRDFVYEAEELEWEHEADAFALNKLIPEAAYAYFIAVHNNNFTESNVKEFAASQCVPPSVVVGRLQHEKRLAPNRLNGLKKHFEWAS
ncbi:MAG: ImmA/IrrE family metallo-endopeptidase, partial [Schwartzia sp.]|nr:ImmA/IrrE family metallo-endopeptidase [Schwartzia sp. (in: firmicutes)]